jgi:hypothetical protein
MLDAFVVLGNDHAEIRKMVSALEESLLAEGGVNDTVLAARASVVRWLVMDLPGHEAAEEEYFWPVVRALVRDGDRLADRACGQEARVRAILDRLGALDPADPEFDDLLRQLIPAVRRHVEFEEIHVWPDLRQALSARQARKLGEGLRQARKCAGARDSG